VVLITEIPWRKKPGRIWGVPEMRPRHVWRFAVTRRGVGIFVQRCRFSPLRESRCCILPRPAELQGWTSFGVISTDAIGTYTRS
jgi:hypothetical protein